MNTCGNPHCNGYCGKCPRVSVVSDSRNVVSDGRTNYDADAVKRLRQCERDVVEAALTEHRAFEEAERQINKPVLDWDSHKVTAAREAWEIAKHAYRAAVRALDAAEG